MRTHQHGSADQDRMRLPELVRICGPLIVPWTLQLGSVYLLLLAVARLLSPADYGAAVTAMSIYLILTAAPVAIQARQVSVPTRWEAIARTAVLAGLAALAATPLLAFSFDLPPATLTLLAPALAFMLVSARLHALPAATAERPVTMAPWAAAAARVAIGIPLTAAFGLGGILAAVVAADGLALGIVAWAVRRPIAARRAPALHRFSPGVPLAPAVMSITSLVLLAHLDLLLARYHLPAPDAGLYAGAGTLTRLLLLVPAIGAALVMRRSGATGGEGPFRWLHRSLAATAVAVATLLAVVSLLRVPVTVAVLGPGQDGAAELIPILAATAGLLALVWQLSFVHVVAASKGHLMLLAVVPLQLVAVAIVTPSADTIAVIALAGAAAAACLHYVGARAISRWSPPLAELHAHEEIVPTPPRDQDIELSMILPCYNPGSALKEFLERLTIVLQDEGVYEIIVVSDGSTDESVELARLFRSPHVRVLHYSERAGKGHALRVGLTMARGSSIGFIDADGEIDPQAVGPFLSLMHVYRPDVVLGSKRHPMSQVSYPMVRRLMSWVYHKIARLLFRINVRDTQTGLKLIRKEVLTQVLPRMFEKRYAFDLELLVVARLLGFTNVFEAPVRIDHRFSSNVNPEAVFRILLDTAAIFYRRYILDTYRHAGDRLLIVRNDDENG